MTLELLTIGIVDHVFILFFLQTLATLSLLNLDLVNDIKGASINALQICATHVQYAAPLFNLFKEAIANMAHKLLSFDLFKMFFYFLIHRQPMLPIAKQFFDHFPIGRSPSVLILFGHLNACTAIPSPDVLHEVGTITDRLTLQCEDKWARPQVEAIGTADGVDVFTPILIGLNDDLDGNVRAVLLKELAKHLTLRQERLSGF